MIRIPEKCKNCQIKIEKNKCKECNGEGFIECPTCQGLGEKPED